MKKVLSVLLALSLIACIIPLSALTSAATPVKGYVDGSNVRVRTGPGTSYDIVTSLSYVYVDILGQSGSWYNINYNGTTGFMSSEFIRVTEYKNDDPQPVVDDTNFEDVINEFPTSYRSSLRALHAQYPNWQFVPKKLSLSIDEAVALEKGYKINSSGISANESELKYYLSPENFLNADDIFMYMPQTRIESQETREVLSQVVNNTFMNNDTYINALLEASRQSGVSSSVLAATIIQEQGSWGQNNQLICGSHHCEQCPEDLTGYYNFYNIGAIDSNPVHGGLKRAKAEGWNSIEAALIGGARWCGNNYITAGQYTFFYMDYNLLYPDKLYHQYATFIGDAKGKAAGLAKFYKNNAYSAAVLEIPVYADSVYTNTESNTVKVHAADVGWMNSVPMGEQAGDGAHQIEALMINIATPQGVNINYAVHTTDIGWMGEVSNSNFAGTVGEAKAIQALYITCEGENAKYYDIWYHVYVPTLGWLGWAKNGEYAGTAGYNLPITAMQVSFCTKNSCTPNRENAYLSTSTSFSYRNSINGIGWTPFTKVGPNGYADNTHFSEGFTVRLETSDDVRLNGAAYVSGLGWTSDAVSGQTVGLSGSGKPVECVSFDLVGKDSYKYEIWYRVFVKDKGWLGWTNNGCYAGSYGNGLFIGAIEMQFCKSGEFQRYDGSQHFIGCTLNYNINIANMGTTDYAYAGQGWGYGGSAAITSYTVQFASEYHLKILSRAYIGGSWTDTSTNGMICGTTDNNRKIEAISMEFAGNDKNKFDICYRVCIENVGWLDWAKSGEVAGSMDIGRPISAIMIAFCNKGDLTDNDPTPSSLDYELLYNSHVSDVGWMNNVSIGQTSGLADNSHQVEAIAVSLRTNKNLGVEYCAHVSDIGWQNYVSSGNMAGTTGQCKKIEAIKIRLTGADSSQYNIYYRAYVKGHGWLGWAKNGEEAGSTGMNLPMTGLQIRICKVGEYQIDDSSPSCIEDNFSYTVHLSDIGWTSEVGSGVMNGTGGEHLIEAFIVNFPNSKGITINYNAHVSDIGWQNYVTSGNIAGTTGMAKSVEAVTMYLSGENAANYELRYRVCVRGLGWQDYVSNKEVAGTTGRGLPISAIQIELNKIN